MIRKALFGNSSNWSLSSSSYNVSQIRDTFYGSHTSFSWPNCSWMFSNNWSSTEQAWSWNWSNESDGIHVSWDLENAGRRGWTLGN